MCARLCCSLLNLRGGCEEMGEAEGVLMLVVVVVIVIVCWIGLGWVGWTGLLERRHPNRGPHVEVARAVKPMP